MAKGQRTSDGMRYEIDHTRHHRLKNWDYRGRGIYHFTLVIAERFPLLGELVGEKPEEASISLNSFGRYVLGTIQGLPQYYAPKDYSLKIIAVQMMPDHIHVVIQVLEPMPRSIGHVIRGLKSACTKEYRRMSVEENALKNEREVHNRDGLKNATKVHNRDGLKSETGVHNRLYLVQFERIFTRMGSIWEKDEAHYHERILHKEASLQVMIDYVKDNPRRLAMKRANPELFKIKQQTQIGDGTYTTLGNIFLAKNPQREVLQCSRTMTEEEIAAKREACLAEAANGTVYISAAVSPGEKTICRALREAGYLLIILLAEGFPKPDSPQYNYYKPSGVYFEACAKGRLLLVEPSEEQFERGEIEAAVVAKAGEIPHTSQRYRFLALNAIAEEIARGEKRAQK